MEKKFIIKEIYSGNYYCGIQLGWDSDIRMADRFDEIEDAERFIERDTQGVYQIEIIYVVW